MKIDFKLLQELSEYLEKKQIDKFVDFLNGYEGNDIFEKFRNILKDWEYHVAHTLSLNIDSKPMKIQLSYLLDQMPLEMNDELVSEQSGVKLILNTPKKFTSTEVIPMSDIIQSITVNNYTINSSEVKREDMDHIIEGLPASTFNHTLNTIIDCPSKSVSFSNPALKQIKLHFLTRDPLNFLIGLFGNFTKDYFRQILFYLAKRISCDVIMNSDIHDIEFFIGEYNKEVKDQQESGNPTIA